MAKPVYTVGPEFLRLSWVRGDSQNYDVEVDLSTINATGATCQITGKQGSTTVFSKTPTVTVTGSGSQIASFTWTVTAAEAAAMTLEPCAFDAELTIDSNVYTCLLGQITVREDVSI